MGDMKDKELAFKKILSIPFGKRSGLFLQDPA